MFPDFLKVKEKLQKMHADKMMLDYLIHMGPLASVPVSIIFEGNKTTVMRPDGSVEKRNLEEITAELEVKLAEFEKMNHETVLDKINGVTEDMAGKMKKSLYEQIEKSASKVGNMVDAGGQPFSIGLLLEMLEKMDIDFDEAGNPTFMMVAGPKLQSSINKALADPENSRRYQALMERKKEEWRARESNRKLVG